MHYSISTYIVTPSGREEPSELSQAFTRRDEAERYARRMPGHVEVWTSWWTRVGREITGTAHRRVLVVRDGRVTARARRVRVGCEENGDGNCAACQLSGVTEEQARRLAPRYMAALDALPIRADPVPAEPHGECWDCRVLRAAGYDPASLV